MSLEKSDFLYKVLKLHCLPPAIIYNVLENRSENPNRSKNQCAKCRNITQYRNVLRVYKKRPVKKWIIRKICSICNRKISQKLLKSKKGQQKPIQKKAPQTESEKSVNTPETNIVNKKKLKIKTNMQKVMKKTQKTKRAKYKALTTKLATIATKSKSSKSLLKQFMDSVIKT